jgi:tripartite-type tricarboxylate transporter receptor subunit TctC
MISAAKTFAALLIAAAAGAAQAQAWPAKPVKLINPFPAGGGTDTFARPLAAKLGTALGQPIIVENLGGAGGTLGATTASKQPADGYTFFMGATHHAIAESLYPKLGYNIERDFVPVAIVAILPNVVVVNPKLPVKSVKELVAYAKANPDKLNFGSAGNGTSHHLAGELFKTMTGTQLMHVPYRGAGPMMQDLLGGNVDLAFDGMGSSAAQIKSGKLRPLAVTAPRRASLLPEVPTMSEAGVAGYEVTTWYAIWAIKGTPQPIVDRMSNEIGKALQAPDIKAIWDQQGAVGGTQSPAEFAAFLHAEIARWGKVVKDANVKVDL